MSQSVSIASVFADVLGVSPESITGETSPENTPQWDSLKAMDLVLGLEEAFDVRFSTKEIVSMRTVAIVQKVLLSKGIDTHA
jgi:acyl carrier protein